MGDSRLGKHRTEVAVVEAEAVTMVVEMSAAITTAVDLVRGCCVAVKGCDDKGDGGGGV